MSSITSFCPKSQLEWREWLELNHLNFNGVWLVIIKQKTSQPNLTWSQAVDEALCFG